jgi:drug/metabolite transporter (DMT)-like permease
MEKAGATLSGLSERSSANLQGYGAILLWSFSALFISWTSEIPPMLTASLTSVVGFLIFGLSWVIRPKKFVIALHQSWPIYGLFFLSIVVYRGFYLAGLKLAPIIEGNLLNYLWPLLIVLLAALYDRIPVPAKVLGGTVSCFVGVTLIGLAKNTGGFSFASGHIFALVGAFTWACYSVLTRNFPSAPTETMGFMHFIAIWVFAGLHVVFEPPLALSNISLGSWIGVCGWGMSLSVAYRLWDKAMSLGARDKVAVAAYYTPLLSTLWLILLDSAQLNWFIALAAAFILGGSLLARTAKNERG